MPKVTIVRPNITKEQEEKALERIADVLEKMAIDKYGFEVKYKLHFYGPPKTN
jgi:hypothetical protein